MTIVPPHTFSHSHSAMSQPVNPHQPTRKPDDFDRQVRSITTASSQPKSSVLGTGATFSADALHALARGLNQQHSSNS